jgi:hypothetical protein
MPIFSVADVVAALRDSADPKQYIKKMRRRDPELDSYWGTICTPLDLRAPDAKITVEIKGVDVYDPTTGAIRSSSTDDIACWFIDTNYNAESFFVRHAYFTGADEPYKRLKRALRAEIDEAAWSELYSTTSRPFDPPETGKIAVKVINHYGDEVLKVYEIEAKK